MYCSSVDNFITSGTVKISRLTLRKSLRAWLGRSMRSLI